ncbi:MAG: hypothetical protein K2U26_13500 [Cyclobacteriaceae bacterium]|nr:hypothetical protein [Cyclobacteriaceae bacterium]
MPLLFPRPFAFAVDDLGWNEGSDLSQDNLKGPHRAGVKRIFDIRDYQYMVEVGKAVGARIQCLFILSEMDRENILVKFPTTTYLRDKWDNRLRVNEHQRDIMNYVRDQSAYMEFGLHGTGHEYWAPGENQKRAEWYNLTDKKPWPEQSLREHIQCFKEIMAQYGFASEHGHSFPESFVPCAYSYYWNPTGEYSLGKLLTEVGVKYANTDFSQIPELNPPPEKNGGDFDYGTHVVNRINYGNPWYELASLPRTPLEEQETDMIESHWPNWLAQDNFLQPEVTKQWIDYYKSVQQTPDRYIAKNTEQFHSQWLYKKYTVVTEHTSGHVEIDNTPMPESAYQFNILGNMVLKVKLNSDEHISEATLNGLPLATYFEESGFGFLYLPPLKKQKYQLKYTIGVKTLPMHILNDGTYNVYEVNGAGEHLSFRLRMYGTQTVKVKCPLPKNVSSDSKQLVIQSFSYNQELSLLSIEVCGTDMQGSTGIVKIQF